MTEQLRTIERLELEKSGLEILVSTLEDKIKDLESNPPVIMNVSKEQMEEMVNAVKYG